MMRFYCQAIPKRLEFVEHTKQQIPDLEVVVDRMRDPVGTFCRILELADNRPFVGLEDDIVLTSNFREKVIRATTMFPRDVINFFFFAAPDHDPVKPFWMPGRSFEMTQCYYLPAGASLEILPFVRAREARTEHDHGDSLAWDAAIGDWLVANRQQYLCWFPPLVQHMALDSAVREGARRNRQASFFQP